MNNDNKKNEDQGINTTALHNLMFFIIIVLLLAILYFTYKNYYYTLNPIDIEKIQYYNTY